MKSKILLVIFAVFIASILFIFKPYKGEAAITCGACASAVILFQPANCDAGVMEQLCSSVTSFLNDEAAKTEADLKACKDKCGWKKRKDDLIDAARKKAKESCSKGEAPDVNELSKGLDRNTKDKLKDLYNRNSRMFDGTAKLKAVDFNAASSKNATITGKTASLSKGGNVTDLKSSEPDTPKLNTASEFSLSGKKLSGEASGKTTVKQSPILLASASSAKSQTALAASAKTASAAEDPKTCDACNQLRLETGQFSMDCMGICCTAGEISDCKTLCDNHYNAPQLGFASPCDCYKKYNSQYYNSLPSCVSLGKRFKNWLYGLFGREPCGEGYYKAKTECCSGEAAFPKQACTADLIIIGDPTPDLVLGKPPTYSQPVTLQATIKCCPGTIQWTTTSDKIQFTGATNQATVQITPIKESEKNSDISVTVTVAGGTSATKKLTVRRPKFLSHGTLPFDNKGVGINDALVGTPDKFKWTLTDQLPTVSYPLGRPLANVTVTEFVYFDNGKSQSVTVEDVRKWPLVGYITSSETTNAAGQMNDQYLFQLRGPVQMFTAVLNQKLIALGYSGMTNITITNHEITGTTPVELR